MASPQKNTVDYFPHLIGTGKKIAYIENKYGNDGYAVWFKLLETLAASEYHFLNLNDDTEFMYLSAKCRVSDDLLLAIINDLVKLKAFDKNLWNSRILWSETLISSIEDAYKRRANKCMQYDGLCKHLLGLGIHIADINTTISNNNPQSKVKKSKVKKSNIKPEVETSSIDPGKFINYFNSKSGRNFRVTEKVKTALLSRQKEYSKSDIQKAVDNAHLDAYHIETNFKYLTPEFILRVDKLEKFINQIQPNPQENEPAKTGGEKFVLGQKPLGAVRHV